MRTINLDPHLVITFKLFHRYVSYENLKGWFVHRLIGVFYQYFRFLRYFKLKVYNDHEFNFPQYLAI